MNQAEIFCVAQLNIPLQIHVCNLSALCVHSVCIHCYPVHGARSLAMEMVELRFSEMLMHNFKKGFLLKITLKLSFWLPKSGRKSGQKISLTWRFF